LHTSISRENLIAGDSGSIVYIKRGEVKFALGIFIGIYDGEKETEEIIYQAVLLHQALKDLKQDYNFGKLQIHPIQVG